MEPGPERLTLLRIWQSMQEVGAWQVVQRPGSIWASIECLEKKFARCMPGPIGSFMFRREGSAGTLTP